LLKTGRTVWVWKQKGRGMEIDQTARRGRILGQLWRCRRMLTKGLCVCVGASD
jgi:hypothetical protein